MKKISALVCDDSALMRRLITRMIESDPRMQVVGTAVNGRFALEKIPKLNPDIIILDIEMPEMNGIEFLKEKRKQRITTPVIVLSSLVKKGANITMQALSLGASDFLLKPSGSISMDIEKVSSDLKKLILIYGGGNRFGSKMPLSLELDTDEALDEKSAKSLGSYLDRTKVPAPLPPSKRPKHSRIDIVGIGISTGGPNALRRVFAALEKDFPVPILVVQHMPEGFTAEFADSLNSISQLEIKEAIDGEVLQAGTIYIAPGSAHLTVEKTSLGIITKLDKSELVNGHRPSVDVLFESVRKTYGINSLGIIMTGMGRDGALGLGSIYNAGGFTIAQDQESSVVYGMPRVAAEYGYVDKIVSLSSMAHFLTEVVLNSRA